MFRKCAVKIILILFFVCSPSLRAEEPATKYYLKSIKDSFDKCNEFDSNKNEYRVVEKASFEQYPYKGYAATYYVCAFMPEFGVIMWGESSGIFLNKHESSIKYPVVEVTDSKTKKKENK